MIRVQLRPNEPLESALRRFKRQCNYAGIFRSAKKYSFYEKRSDKQRREARERIRNIQRAARKAQGRDRGVRGGRSRTRRAPRDRGGDDGPGEGLSVSPIMPMKPAISPPNPTPERAVFRQVPDMAAPARSVVGGDAV